jgi:hypothetical protein
MGSPTLQTHQYPILLLPWLWFEMADQTLTHWPQPACWGILVCPPSTAPLGSYVLPVQATKHVLRWR